MKKIHCLLILMLIIFSFLIFPDVNVRSVYIGEHETSDGTVNGTVVDSDGDLQELIYVFYFNAKSFPYWVNYPNNLIDGNPDTYAFTAGDGLGLPFEDPYNASGNNCTGSEIGGNISTVEIRTRGRDNTGTIRLNLTARYNGALSGETFSWSPPDYNNQYSPWYDITDDTNAPSVWTFGDVDNLDVRLVAYIPSGLTSHQVYASIIQIRVIVFQPFNVTRNVFSESERESFNFIPDFNITNTVLKIPISNDVDGIVDVTNNTDDIMATEVNSSDDLVNNTFWYDSANQYVYVATVNLTISTVVNWTINCSYGATFNINIPQYLRIGDYLMMDGLIENASGESINNMIARTYIYHSNGSIAIGNDPPIKWNCTGGNYRATISTNILIPGVYSVVIKFTDPESGIVYSEGGVFYLSYDTPSGVYSDAIVYFNFYNTNFGLGLPRETLKVYVDDQRLYQTFYYTYTGNTINVTVQDYYNQTLYSNNFTITNTRTFLDLGLTFHSWLFGNRNEDYYMISLLKYGGSRWWEEGIITEREFLIPSGNYTLRIYDKDDNEIYNSSGNISVVNSRVYVIYGTNLTEIISGQSVIRGQLLELSSEMDYALMSDVNIIGTNPPLIFITMNKEGMALGDKVYKICPTFTVQAITRVKTDGNWINSTARIPGNDTVENGTIILLKDKIYISGPWNTTWVNITYTDNNTIMQNTSYIPGIIYLSGQNITINGSHDLHVTRECEYNQQKKFEWNYYSATGFHTTGIDINNPMDIPIYDVGIFVEFSNRSNPDESTVVIRDHANNGEILERGVNYKVYSSGIEFYISSIDADDTRRFTMEYLKEFADNYYYGEEQIYAGYIEKGKVLNNEYYNYVDFLWINDQDKIFRGGLLVKIDETKITEIQEDSVKVYDLDNNILLDRLDDYIVGDTFIRISYDALGDVPSGGGRNFGVYFQIAEYPGANPEEIHLSTPIVILSGLPITPFFIIFIICMALIVSGVIISVKKQKLTDGSKILIGIGSFIVVIFFLLQNIGI